MKKKIETIFFFEYFLFLEVFKVLCPGRKMSGFLTVRIPKILRPSAPDVMSGRALRSIVYAVCAPS